MIDPVTGAMIAQMGSSLIGNMLGSGSQQPTDSYSISQLMLRPESGAESSLAQLQQMLFKMAALSQQPRMPTQINPQMQSYIDQATMGGIDTMTQQAYRQAEEMAMSRGLGGGSSIQANAMGQAMEPAIAQANQMRAQMMYQALQEEIQRMMAQQQFLAQLRQQTIANQIGVQSSPALDRLTQLRMASSPQQQMTMNRKSGGLPEWAGDQFGLPSSGGGGGNWLQQLLPLLGMGTGMLAGKYLFNGQQSQPA
jgi:hypothetical protein